MIELRAHHLLCIVGWRGHGYDRVFKVNFNRLVDSLYSGSEIKLIEGSDDICAYCPRLDASLCRAGEYGDGAVASLIDGRVLKRLDLRVGEVHRFEWLRNLLREKITPESLSEICAGCGWLQHGWCSEALKTIR